MALATNWRRERRGSQTSAPRLKVERIKLGAELSRSGDDDQEYVEIGPGGHVDGAAGRPWRRSARHRYR
ncbi:hypothetical protein [Plantactinospora sp. KLBMP9567]|uniref:hypothetical protein n=1 Tax=Plantactinospora sp. KLBMP9567 TaxID=3085900 RepID=UPI0029826EB4|nr:hypothetical protein [Plantactinospora sp. KLBMP9567]MDW5326161.1 hypothetical protein [Plantactinospora sp. KLBMP9567]